MGFNKTECTKNVHIFFALLCIETVCFNTPEWVSINKNICIHIICACFHRSSAPEPQNIATDDCVTAKEGGPPVIG